MVALLVLSIFPRPLGKDDLWCIRVQSSKLYSLHLLLTSDPAQEKLLSFILPQGPFHWKIKVELDPWKDVSSLLFYSSPLESSPLISPLHLFPLPFPTLLSSSPSFLSSSLFFIQLSQV